jgi:HAD superfamily hydrolase (TIGR01509 family)
MRAVLFDFDGVLVNSEPLHYSALRDALLPEGIAIDEESYVRDFLAFDDRGAIRRALEHHGQAFDRERVERVALRKAQLFEERMHEIPFFPGARELVRALEAEVPLAIASGALSAEIEAMLSAGGVREAFTAVVGADQVRRSKPHPEPYLTAMTRVAAKAQDLRPDQCLVIEDSMPGIAAGLAAGMRVVAVTNSYPAAKLSAAHRVVASLEELTLASLRALFD